jgi:DNA-binding LacI/PurR family transcriptional regulator
VFTVSAVINHKSHVGKAICDISPTLRQMMQEMKIPIVLAMRTFPKISKDAVVTDDYQGAFDGCAILREPGQNASD